MKDEFMHNKDPITLFSEKKLCVSGYIRGNRSLSPTSQQGEPTSQVTNLLSFCYQLSIIIK